MRKSRSHSVISSRASTTVSSPQAPYQIKGNLVKHEPKFYTSNWTGLSLKEGFNSTASVSKLHSPRRWQEYTNSRRTIDPTYPEKPQPVKARHATPKFSTGNLAEMIDNGYKPEAYGAPSRRVTRAGKVFLPNTTSFENFMNTRGVMTAYKSKGNYLCPNHQTERRLRKSTPIAQTRKQSQISTIPGPHRQVQEEVRPVRVKPDFNSHLNELPGYLKTPEKAPEPENPMKKVARYTATTSEQEELIGTTPSKHGPKTTIVPSNPYQFKSYSEVGREKDLNPYTKGKAVNAPARSRLLQTSSQEYQFNPSKKPRPQSVRDAFASNIGMLG